MRRLVLLATLVMLPCAALSAGGDSKNDLEALQGNWTFVSAKSSTGDAPPEESLKSMSANVKGDEMKSFFKGETAQVIKLTLDAAKQPKSLDFLHQDGPDKGGKQLGIYKLEGDLLTICTNDDFTAKAERPKEFSTKEGTKIRVLVLKKAK